MKKLIAAALAATAIAAFAVPSQNTYHAVTNDWYQGNYSNVYELAQQRLAANTNDLVAAVIMETYDLRFSSFAAISNSILRVMRASEAATLPAYTNMWSVGGAKVRTLWPNPAWTDNHVVAPTNSVDYNFFFRSPRVVERAIR